MGDDDLETWELNQLAQDNECDDDSDWTCTGCHRRNHCVCNGDPFQPMLEEQQIVNVPYRHHLRRYDWRVY